VPGKTGPGRELAKEKRRQLGQELRQLRESCGLGIHRLADEIGFDFSHISNVELGKRNPSATFIEKFVKRCGGSSDQIKHLKQLLAEIHEAEGRRRDTQHKARGPRRRPLWIIAAAAVVALGVIGAVLALSRPTTPIIPTRFRCDSQIFGLPDHIWVSIHPTGKGRARTVTLRWGAKVATVQTVGPTSLVADKGSDNTALYVKVEPPAGVTCGRGTPPDPNPIDIRGELVTPG